MWNIRQVETVLDDVEILMIKILKLAEKMKIRRRRRNWKRFESDKLASRAERKPVDEMDKVEIDNNNFHLAQLTSEELDALLGSEPDKNEEQ